MAKRFGKFLMFTAVAGAVAAGAYYYLQNKNSSFSDDLDDDNDFDDFSDDLDEEADHEDNSRTYVDLHLEKAEDAVSETAGQLKDAVGETAETVKEAAKDIAETAQSKVEEFFDDDDNSADSI